MCMYYMNIIICRFEIGDKFLFMSYIQAAVVDVVLFDEGKRGMSTEQTVPFIGRVPFRR
jgi:hypothetical protein